jgi:hypothetical protein
MYINPIHWLVDGEPKCEGLDGSGKEGVEIESPFDMGLLKLTCADCIAWFNAEAKA